MRGDLMTAKLSPAAATTPMPPCLLTSAERGAGRRLITRIADSAPALSASPAKSTPTTAETKPFPALPQPPGHRMENCCNGTKYRGSRRRRRHSGHSRRDGGPGRPAADELHGLGDLPDRADRLGDLGLDGRDRRPALPVHLAAGQGRHPLPVRRPVRLPGRHQHRDRRLRPGLAGRQDRPPQGADPVLAAGRGVHLAVRLCDELPGADRLVDLRHARVRRRTWPSTSCT